MADVDWGLYNPNTFDTGLKQGSDFVDKMVNLHAQAQAAQAYASGDYAGGANAYLRAGDIANAEKLRGLGAKRQAGQQYATGDYAGAGKTLAQSGDIAGAETLADKQAATFQKQHDYMGRAVPVLSAIYQKAGPDALSQGFEQLVPELQGIGTDPGQIDKLRQALKTNPDAALQAMSALAQKKFSFQKTGENSIAVFDENNPAAGPVYTFTGTPNAPSGYRADPNKAGALAAIPGGPADPDVIKQRAENNRQVIVNNPLPTRADSGAGATLLNDTDGTPYIKNIRHPELPATDLQGNPYTPKGAQRLATGVAPTSLTPEAIKSGALSYAQTGQFPVTARDRATQAAIYNQFVANKPQGTSDEEWAGGLKNAIIAFNAQKQAAGATAKQGALTVINENTVNNSIKILKGLLDKNVAGTAGLVSLNDAGQWMARQTNDKDAVNLKNAIATISSEYARVMTGQTGGAASSDRARDEAAERILLGYSKGTMLADVAQLQQEMAGRSASYADALNQFTGGTYSGVQPQSTQGPPAAVPGVGGKNIDSLVNKWLQR